MNLLYDILRIQSHTRKSKDMEQFIINYCVDKDYAVELDYRNIYVTKGEADIYPCFAAHTDTVHPLIPTNNYSIRTKKGKIYAWDRFLNRPTGVGGDDKVGIFIALDCLDKLEYGKAAFFHDEEAGCLGSSAAQLEFFDDCAFVLQADRKGSKDFVAMAIGIELFGDEFQEAVAPILEDLGYRFEYGGGMTDVSTLKDIGLDIACANVSCGYYNPHMATEYVDIREVKNTRNLFLIIARELAYQKWHHVDETDWSQFAWGQNYWVDRDKITWYDSYSERCSKCHNEGVLEYDEEARLVFCWNCQDYVGEYGITRKEN